MKKGELGQKKKSECIHKLVGQLFFVSTKYKENITFRVCYSVDHVTEKIQKGGSRTGQNERPRSKRS